MLDMAKPKKRGRPARPGRKGKPINVWIAEELREALDGFIDTSRPRGSLTEHIEIAIEEYLAKRSHWPQAGEAN
jgi:hypothetical protein